MIRQAKCKHSESLAYLVLDSFRSAMHTVAIYPVLHRLASAAISGCRTNVAATSQPCNLHLAASAILFNLVISLAKCSPSRDSKIALESQPRDPHSLQDKTGRVEFPRARVIYHQPENILRKHKDQEGRRDTDVVPTR